jgi:Cu2+-exporting ATPase
MEVGALLMSLSTIVVALNAQLLRRLDLHPQASVTAALGARPVSRGPVRREPATPGAGG